MATKRTERQRETRRRERAELILGALLAVFRRLLSRPLASYYLVDDAAVAGRKARDAFRREEKFGDLVSSALTVETAVVALALAALGVMAETAAVLGGAASDPGAALVVVIVAAALVSVRTATRTWALLVLLAVLTPIASHWVVALALLALVTHVAWARFHAELGYLADRRTVSTWAILARGNQIAINEAP